MQTTMIPLSKIQPSITNPRRQFDPEKMTELVNSVKAIGVLQPILVRPIKLDKITRQDQINKGRDPERFELIAGERRFRASTLAGLAAIPTIVRDLTDREALEVQVIENEIRSDVLPSERAAGYGRLIAAGATMQEIADRVGKSVSTIRNILLLCRLPRVAQEALDADVIPRSTAELIARLPREEQREEATRDILKGEVWRKDEDGKPIPFTFRQAKDYIESNHQVELKNCGFDPKDKKLLPEAGSCTDCLKRLGNLQKLDPITYAGGRADVCTDPKCFEKKREIQNQIDDEKFRKEAEANAKADQPKKRHDPAYVRAQVDKALGIDVTSGTQIEPLPKIVNPLPPIKPGKPDRRAIGIKARSLAMTVLSEYAAEQSSDLEGYNPDGLAPWVEALRLAVLGYCAFLCAEQPNELNLLSIANIKLIHTIDPVTEKKITSDYGLWLNFVEQASPAQLIGFLVSASAVFTLDMWSEGRERPDPNYWAEWVDAGDRLLTYAELDWPQLWDQAERELTTGKRADVPEREAETS